MAKALSKPLASAPQGAITLNRQVANSRYGTGAQTVLDEPLHKYKITVYEPTGPINCVVVCFPGGGNDADGLAQQLFVKIGSGTPTVAKTQWATLKYFNAALWIVTGGIPDGVVSDWNPNGGDLRNVVNARGTLGVEVFSNFLTWDGRDTKQFVKDMLADWVTTYGTSIIRVAFGHSDGGVLVQRLRFEHVAGMFSAYATACAPPADYYSTNSTQPAIVKPSIAYYAANDSNIGIAGGHFGEAQWAQRVQGFSKANYSYPNPSYFAGDFVGFQARVNAYNTANSLAPETVSSTIPTFALPTDNTATSSDGNIVLSKQTAPGVGGVGLMTTWTYSGGKQILKLLDSSDHNLGHLQSCLGHAVLKDVLGFAYANAAG